MFISLQIDFYVRLYQQIISLIYSMFRFVIKISNTALTADYGHIYFKILPPNSFLSFSKFKRFCIIIFYKLRIQTFVPGRDLYNARGTLWSFGKELMNRKSETFRGAPEKCRPRAHPPPPLPTLSWIPLCFLRSTTRIIPTNTVFKGGQRQGRIQSRGFKNNFQNSSMYKLYI